GVVAPAPAQPLRDSGPAARERGDPGADARADLLARQHALRRAHGLLDAVTGVRARSAPIFLSWPCRAQRPDSGATSAILTSSAAAAGTGIGEKRIVAATSAARGRGREGVN